MFDVQDDDVDYGFSLADGTPLHSRLVSEPLIPVLDNPAAGQPASDMALHPPSSRPPPLTIDPNGRAMSSSSTDSKQPKTPGGKISSFFGWRAASSPGADSTSTEISDASRSPVSPMPASGAPAKAPPSPVDVSKANGYFPPVRPPSPTSASVAQGQSRLSELENELREISSELAGSIRREMEQEDLIEKLQSEMPMEPNRRTSDYFSDSGTSSTKYALDNDKRIEDFERIRRNNEQERAQLKVDLSQRWQEEKAQRNASESHIQILENQVQQVGSSPM